VVEEWSGVIGGQFSFYSEGTGSAVDEGRFIEVLTVGRGRCLFCEVLHAHSCRTRSVEVLGGCIDAPITRQDMSLLVFFLQGSTIGMDGLILYSSRTFGLFEWFFG
jgi:hypothetical protein